MSEKPVDADIVRKHFDELASDYDQIKNKNYFYSELLKKAVADVVPRGSRVLEIGTATGEVLAFLKPLAGTGIDISPKMIGLARRKFPQYRFEAIPFERFTSSEAYDYIVLADVIEHLESPERLFEVLKGLCQPKTRVILTMANPFWEPFLELLEKWHLKMDEGPHFRVAEKSLEEVARRHGFRLESLERSVLMPVRIPLITGFANHVLARLPGLKRLALICRMVFRLDP